MFDISFKNLKRLSIPVIITAASSSAADDYQWLEEVLGEQPLAWVEAQNSRSVAHITAYPGYQELYENTLEILNSDVRIPDVSKRGDYYYNFWQDAVHVRGIMRRTTLEEYRKESPAWETVLDLDALAASEGMAWVYKGVDCLFPDYELCLIDLSVGGADAVVTREFNMTNKSFVEGGFHVPESKSRTSWLDKNTLFVGTDFGAGSLTDSGYPRITKIWRRGTPLAEAQTLYEGNAASVSVTAYTLRDGDNAHYVVQETPSFFSTQRWAYRDGQMISLNIPLDASLLGIFQNDIFIELKSDWQGMPQGAIIHASYDALIGGSAEFSLFIAPAERASIEAINFTGSSILVTWLDNVRSRVERYRRVDGQWQASPVEFPSNGAISVFNTDRDSEDFFVRYQDFLSPPTVYRVDGANLQNERLKGLPAMFDASGYVVEQFESTSTDGTKIPYFVVRGKDIALDGSNPTLMYGYGGFEISYGPNYSATTGRNWLDQGGVYVLANIRGGGEFGPKWHQAALLHNRHKAFEDFESVAEDLIARGITSSPHLGMQGGSNGGLLVGSVFTRRPELFNAVVCQVPLLDMQRYNKLLAGASWMAEYGNPDIAEDWEYIQTYSPYHNVKADVEYPRVFFTTSTRDDRVHPGHARKMVAKMTDMGHDVLYFENTEGGHAGSANNEQRARVTALMYAYLWEELR